MPLLGQNIAARMLEVTAVEWGSIVVENLTDNSEEVKIEICI